MFLGEVSEKRGLNRALLSLFIFGEVVLSAMIPCRSRECILIHCNPGSFFSALTLPRDVFVSLLQKTMSLFPEVFISSPVWRISEYIVPGNMSL